MLIARPESQPPAVAGRPVWRVSRVIGVRPRPHRGRGARAGSAPRGVACLGACCGTLDGGSAPDQGTTAAPVVKRPVQHAAVRRALSRDEKLHRSHRHPVPCTWRQQSVDRPHAWAAVYGAGAQESARRGPNGAEVPPRHDGASTVLRMLPPSAQLCIAHHEGRSSTRHAMAHIGLFWCPSGRREDVLPPLSVRPRPPCYLGAR